MDQISPPMRIALAVALLFTVAWFTVLKPKDDTSAASATPIATPANAGLANDPNGPTAKTGAGKAVQQANGAAQAQEQSDAATGAAADGTAAATATPGAAAATPAPTSEAGGAEAPAKPVTRARTIAKSTGLPSDISRALARKQVVVLLFWARNGSDDRAVRRAVRGLGSAKVLVHVAPVRKVARYAAITQGVDVARSPSVIVIDRKRKAQLLAGYVSRDTIRQAIADARRPAT